MAAHKQAWRLQPLTLAMAIALTGSFSASALAAQDAAQQATPQTAAEKAKADKDIEVIEVTGSFRDSLSNALNVKRQSDSAIDAIMAEDIADFPDLNLAEYAAAYSGCGHQPRRR